MKHFILFFICFLGQAQSKDTLTSKEFQEDLNKHYADSTSSPLQEKDRINFKGLDFFPIDDKYNVKATFVRTKKEKSFKMKTTTSREPLYVKYGEVHFRLEEKELVLNVYQNIELSKKPGYKDYLFLPFTDLTCGFESYKGGRYLDMRIPEGKELILDFNKAYNPYCVYNYKYSCPIVPAENHLDVEIKAGVKKFHD